MLLSKWKKRKKKGKRKNELKKEENNKKKKRKNVKTCKTIHIFIHVLIILYKVSAKHDIKIENYT